MFEGHSFEDSDNNDFGSEIEKLNAICLVFKASDTRAHERAAIILDRLFSLFGEDVKNNIVVIFTFADSFTNIKALNALKNPSALNALKNPSSPFFKIFGNIEDLPYFAFNNEAYFSDDRETFKKPFNNNLISFGKLLKYIFNLKSVSLESTKTVIKDRNQIKTKIYNLFVELKKIILSVESATFNQRQLAENQKELKILEKNNIDYMEKYFETIQKSVVKQITKYCNSGWYVLYCRRCSKVCHYNCRGPNEGWNSDEYGCDAIRTFGGDCVNCGCNYRRHSFQTSYEESQQFFEPVVIEKFRINNEKKQQKEETEKLKKEMKEKIEKNKEDLNENNKRIYGFLLTGINCLYDLSKTNNELNKLALQKDNKEKKYEYTNKILKENIEAIEKNDISTFFEDSLEDIDNICANEASKEQTVNNFLGKLF